jgi:hypothetical protein
VIPSSSMSLSVYYFSSLIESLSSIVSFRNYHICSFIACCSVFISVRSFCFDFFIYNLANTLPIAFWRFRFIDVWPEKPFPPQAVCTMLSFEFATLSSLTCLSGWSSGDEWDAAG